MDKAHIGKNEVWESTRGEAKHGKGSLTDRREAGAGMNRG